MYNLTHISLTEILQVERRQDSNISPAHTLTTDTSIPRIPSQRIVQAPWSSLHCLSWYPGTKELQQS